MGVFGGTFDPFHNGHLVAAVAARHQLELDMVLLVVANRPWQKEGERQVTPAADRLAMVSAAVEGVPGIEASAIEIERGGPTYTIDTVEALRRDRREAELVLVLGADVAGELGTWHRVDDLRDAVVLAVVTRAGSSIATSELEGWRVERVLIPSLDISSTDIRRRVATGQPIDGLVGPGVVREIEARGLYARS